MLDFTSALYLDLHHPTASLPAWESLTSGRPAALEEAPAAVAVATRLAKLQGCEAATLASSTLHVFWDLFTALDPSTILIDAGTYPIARWGVERASARGVQVKHFRHYDPAALAKLLAHGPPRPVILTDGVCPACGRIAPLAAFLDSVRQAGGCLVIDDTQALGIFGESPCIEVPYGRGGGGTLRAAAVRNDGIVLVTSLAKAFGAPLAALAGSAAQIDRFERLSETRIHCSPPSIAAVYAASRALTVNERRGDALRLRLLHVVQRFRDRVRALGMTVAGGSFPVQTLLSTVDRSAVYLFHRLMDLGVRTVLHRARAKQPARLSFLLTTRHTLIDVERAIAALARLVGHTRLGAQYA